MLLGFFSSEIFSHNVISHWVLLINVVCELWDLLRISVVIKNYIIMRRSKSLVNINTLI